MPLKRAALALLLAACAHARSSPPRQSDAAEAHDSFAVEPYVSPRAYQHYLDALLAKANDDFAAAAQDLREALLYDPESPHLHTVLGEVLLRQGHIAEAESELRAALSYDAHHAPAHFLLARIAAARERPLEAETHLREAIDADPDDGDARRELVRLYVALGNLTAAQESAGALASRMRDAQLRAQHDVVVDDGGTALVASERLREQAAGAWVDVARALAQRGDKSAAEKAFAEARAAQPSDPEALFAQAAFYEGQRRTAEARELYLRLLSQRPESPEVLAALARVALEDGDLDTVRAHARKLIGLAAEIEPQHGESERDDDRRELASALLRVAVPLLGARRSGEAQLAVDAALRLFPDHAELSFYRAMALVQRGRPREGALAFEAIEKRLRAHRGESVQPPLLGIEPETLALDVRVQAALAQSRAGAAQEGLKRLRAIFSERPEEEGVALALLEAFERIGKPEEAEPVLAQAARGAPASDGLLYALGTAQDRIGERTRALATMRKVLSLQPAHAGALNYIGYTLAERGTPDALREADSLLSRAIELRPDDGAVADSYGYCLLRLGRAEQALSELRRADHLSPGDPVILSHLGDALLANGKRAEAQSAFREALVGLTRPRSRAAPREQAALDPADRLPEPGDARIRAELVKKLRALSIP